jgi:hypothetical protein
MKKKIILGVFALFLVLQAQMVFAADYDEDFDKALSKNDLSKAEDIVRKRSEKMDLAQRLERVILNNIKGFNSDNAINVAQMLIRYGANVNAVKRVRMGEYYREAPLLYITVADSGLNKEKIVQMINLLCRSGANPDARNQTGSLKSTALMAASDYKPEWCIAFTKALVENGANVNLKDNEGNTALILNIDDIETFKYLAENKADLNIKNNKGQTALILAAEEEKTDIITYLIQRGVNVNLRDNNGLTAASICYDKGQIDIYNYLKANGAVDYEPKQIAQQAAPSPSTTNVYVQPSTPAPSSSSSSSTPSRNVGKEIADAFKPPLQSGTYSLVGSQEKISIAGIAKSGIITQTWQGKSYQGTYNIDGNKMTVQIRGYTFVFNIISETSFSGHNETWVRTGF